MTSREKASVKKQKNQFVQRIYSVHECPHCDGTGEIADFFGSRLKYLRLRKNQSTAQLTKMLGISSRMYNAIERGASNPNLLIVQKLSLHFNVRADFLLGIINNPKEREFK